MNYSKKHIHKPASNQTGVTLIEILVAILVMGVSALGVASMQMAGLKYNAGSQTRTQASILASDMMDRIRANREIALIGPLYNTQDFVSSASKPSFNCHSSVCTEEQLVDHDKHVWLEQVSTLLPSGEAEILNIDITANQRMYQITLRWRFVANENIDAVDPDSAFQQLIFRSVI